MNNAAGTIYEDGRDYDLLVKTMSTATEAAFYQRRATEQGGPVLELACGTGRLTLPLAATGFDTVGIDIAPSMLEVARHKAAEQNLTNVSLVEADVRDFDLGQQFGLIFFPGNSLAHLHTLADITACFARVRAHLAPNGRFVIDIFNPALSFLIRDPDTRYPVTEFEDGGQQVIVTEDYHYDPATQVSHIRWYYRRDGEEKEIVRHFSMRQFFPQEMDALLTFCGFTIEAKYGGFDESPFTGSSRKQLLVCRPIS